MLGSNLGNEDDGTFGTGWTFRFFLAGGKERPFGEDQLNKE